MLFAGLWLYLLLSLPPLGTLKRLGRGSGRTLHRPDDTGAQTSSGRWACLLTWRRIQAVLLFVTLGRLLLRLSDSVKGN